MLSAHSYSPCTHAVRSAQVVRPSELKIERIYPETIFKQTIKTFNQFVTLTAFQELLVGRVWLNCVGKVRVLILLCSVHQSHFLTMHHSENFPAIYKTFLFLKLYVS